MNPSDLRRTTDALASELVVVPADGEDVCPMCRSWRDPTYELCNNCEQAFNDLSAPCRLVVPISLYAKPSPMRDRLTYYKDPEEPAHARYPREVAAIVERFFYEHGERLQEHTGGWAGVCIVPSESRPPPHPLGEALRGISARYVEVPELLLVRGPGLLGHRVLSDDAFLPVEDVRDRRLLVLDDVYTTGARGQGAASALTLAGAEVVAVVVVGRRVNPSWRPGVQGALGPAGRPELRLQSAPVVGGVGGKQPVSRLIARTGRLVRRTEGPPTRRVGWYGLAAK